MPCDCVYATVVPDLRGECPTVYWSRSRYVGPVLTMLDYERVPLTPDLWPRVATRLEVLAVERQAMGGSIGMFIEGEHLAVQGRAAGYNVIAFPEHLTKDEVWEAMCQSVTLYRKGGNITVTSLAAQRSRDLAFGANTFDFGPRPDDASVPAYVYGVVMALDEAMAAPKRKRPDRVRVVA